MCTLYDILCYLQERLLRYMPAAALQAAASGAQQDSVKRALLQGFVSVRAEASSYSMLLTVYIVHTSLLHAVTCSHEFS
jgi:hypothetical protein